MPDLDDTNNQAADSEQQDQDQDEREPESAKDKASGMVEDAKKKMDRTGDGKFDSEDMKKMGEDAKKAGADAVNKVKGLFKKS